MAPEKIFITSSEHQTYMVRMYIKDTTMFLIHVWDIYIFCTTCKSFCSCSMLLRFRSRFYGKHHVSTLAISLSNFYIIQEIGRDLKSTFLLLIFQESKHHIWGNVSLAYLNLESIKMSLLIFSSSANICRLYIWSMLTKSRTLCFVFIRSSWVWRLASKTLDSFMLTIRYF